MGFSRQEYWSELPFPSPGDLPDPGIKPKSLTTPALAGGFFTTGATWEAPHAFVDSHYFLKFSRKSSFTWSSSQHNPLESMILPEAWSLPKWIEGQEEHAHLDSSPEI